jgi:hypothetical protein
MSNPAIRSMLDELVSEELDGVTFVRDYLQIQFNPPPVMTVYTKCKIVTKDQEATFGEPVFPNLIIGLIGQRVSEVRVESDQVVIVFRDGSRLEISIGTGEGHESIVFHSRKGLGVVA